MTHWTKTLLLAAALFGLFLGAEARPVTLETAQEIATRFMRTGDLHLIATYRTSDNTPAFHIFNTTHGFVIVSADDCETPIIGYSYEGCFDPDNVPVPLEAYLQDFVARMQYGIENPSAADQRTERQWELVKSTGTLHEGRTERSAGPLLTEKWHQGCLYNSLCPTMQGPCGHAEVGCVAVAMGQIMHYWRYPTKGWGSHHYTNAGVTLSANFGETTYAWDQMPDSLTDQSSPAEIEAVSTLLFHCGIAVNMRYTVSGSNATFNDALTRYFDYTRHLRKENRSDYTDEEWITLLKECLDQRQPIFYSGFGSAGHAFVCDGYDKDNLFHFNWGWGGTANGYFSLGNLNPNGHDFSSSNFAILGIVPQYEPCLVSATVFPANAGTVEGIGETHYGASCTLTAVPEEGYDFYCWKRDGQVISYNYSYTFEVLDDISGIEACFTCFPVGQITASYDPDENDPHSPNVSLSWNHEDTEWVLLKQFDIQNETGGIATDGQHIYLTYAAWNDPPINIEKYTMDGDLVEAFNLEGIYDVFSLTYDGTDFYGNGFQSGHLSELYRIDFDNHTILDTIALSTWASDVTYDPEYDGFWLGHDYQTMLYNRQGDKIKTSPIIPDYLVGSVYLTDDEGHPHLLLLLDSGVFEYDIHNNVIKDRPLLDIGSEHSLGYGACLATYDGKEAMVFSMDSTLCFYEIRSTLGNNSQILSYRIYRVDSEGNTVMIADEVVGTSYTDTSWDTVFNGLYRYGICSVYVNGNESEVVWSNPIAKTNYGTDEMVDPIVPSVQKIVENGHLFILVNGKKYTVMGQEVPNPKERPFK